MHRLWLIRHGETDSNAIGQFQGHLDVPLNAKGRAQATALAPCLADVEFDLVLASDLLRAAETAALVINERRPVEYIRELREMNYGVLQGVPYADAALVLAQHGFDEVWRTGDFARRGVRFPQGESPRQVRNRLRVVEDRVAQTASSRPDGSNTMVVAHGGTLAVLMTVLLQLPLHRRLAFRFHNCSVTRLVDAGGGWQLDGHNLDLGIATAGSQPAHPAGEADQLRS